MDKPQVYLFQTQSQEWCAYWLEYDLRVIGPDQNEVLENLYNQIKSISDPQESLSKNPYVLESFWNAGTPLEHDILDVRVLNGEWYMEPDLFQEIDTLVKLSDSEFEIQLSKISPSSLKEPFRELAKSLRFSMAMREVKDHKIIEKFDENEINRVVSWINPFSKGYADSLMNLWKISKRIQKLEDFSVDQDLEWKNYKISLICLVWGYSILMYTLTIIFPSSNLLLFLIPYFFVVFSLSVERENNYASENSKLEDELKLFS